MKKGNGNPWMSVADMMSALMIIFLFIAIAFMAEMQNVVRDYKNTKQQIYLALSDEFHEDLKKWNADLDEDTLTVIFKSPEVLFAQGSSEIKFEFKKILNDFFPRYINILSRETFRDVVQEIRIEGHTSTEWRYEDGTLSSYFKNMEISQNRTRAVLEYCIGIDKEKYFNDWLIGRLTANGLSFSHKIMKDGKEDYKASRRVEFRIRTNADEKMTQLGRKTK